MLDYFYKLYEYLGRLLKKTEEGKLLDEEEIKFIKELWLLREMGNLEEDKLTENK